jgi:hypothetical protein
MVHIRHDRTNKINVEQPSKQNRKAWGLVGFPLARLFCLFFWSMRRHILVLSEFPFSYFFFKHAHHARLPSLGKKKQQQQQHTRQHSARLNQSTTNSVQFSTTSPDPPTHPSMHLN